MALCLVVSLEHLFGVTMTKKDAARDWGLCSQTFNLLCTLVRMGFEFNCPLEKVIRLQVDTVVSEAYRRNK